ncbi:MAG: ATP-binding protein [Chitinispirillales bacterium]|nr:ATP-binding protein [Chitinispirillales bacterium]
MEDKLAMEISADESNSEATVLKISGALDFSSITMLSGFFGKIIAENRSYVIVDMAGVISMCSAALGEFMGYRQKFVEKGGELVFAGLKREIRSKLTLMGANKIFSFYSDVRAAVNAYKWNYEKQSKSLTVAIPSSLKLVPPVRQLASRLAKQKGYGRRDAFRIETIVDEVCNNAVDHGLKDQSSNITVSMAIDKDKFTITVSNQSDPEKVEMLRELLKPAAQNNHVGNDHKRGRGLALIRMLSSDMKVDITESGTSVRVIKLREEE